jgi:acetyltransferase-like isoleucine patch superfamily enzyme
VDKYVLIGSGGMSAEVRSYLADIYKLNGREYSIVGYLESSAEGYHLNTLKYGISAPYLGDPLTVEYNPSCLYVCCVGNPIFRNTLRHHLKERVSYFPNILHPTAIVAPESRLGYGNVVSPFCVIGPNSKIDSLNVFTSYSFVSHDCQIGSSNFFSTGGRAGASIVGDSNFFGIRSTVLPYIIVGSFNTIQAGMHIDKDIGDNETVFYKYKEKIQIVTKG